jgi:DNA-binding CsgD family transcriptional regulator/tetratricopeptide (TPR) repeat protein
VVSSTPRAAASCLVARAAHGRAIAIMLCVRCPVLIGREEQTAMFTDACESARRGFGRAILLVGEAGAGKTRLAECAVGLARKTGITAVVGRAVAETPAVPLRIVSEVLLELTRNEPPPLVPSLKGYVPLLATLLPHWRSEDWRPPEEPLLAMAEGIFRLLREYSAGGGVLVAFEDLHWADTASVAVVRFLVDHIAELAGVILVTVREGEPGSGVTAQLEHAGAQLSSVGRLSDQDVQRMAAACLGVSVVSAEVLAHLWRDAEGLPLLVEDLVGLGASDDQPRRFADVVRARLAQMTPDQQNVLAAAAVLGHRFDWRLLDTIAELPAGTAAAALHRATASQLVVSRQDGFEFRHALTRDVVLHGLATSERQRLALAAAQVLGLEAPTADAGRDFAVARLLIDGGDRLAGARLLLELGRRQLDTGELAVAGAALDQASMLVNGTTELGIVIAYERARAALLTGQSAPASELGRRLIAMVEGRDGALATRTRLLLARAALAAGNWDDAARALRAIRSTSASNPSIAAEAAVLEAHVALGRSQAGSLLAAEHMAAHAVGIAHEASRDDIQCQALEVLGLCARSRDLDVAASALERALDLAETANLGPERLRVLNELGGVEMLRDAVSDRLERARSEALRQGAIGTAVSIGANLAAAWVMTGRYTQAVALAGEVEATAARLGIRPLEAAAQLMMGFAFAHQGRRVEADRHLNLAEALAPDDADLRAGAWGIGRGLLALLEEDRAGARRAFARAHQEMPDQHVRILNPYEGPDLLVAALDGEADLVAAEALLERSVRGARWPAMWAQSAVAVARGAIGDRVAADVALKAAMEASDRYPVFGALAARLVAEAAVRNGWGEPVPLLRAAERTFTGLGLGRAATACRALLSRAGARVPRRRRSDTALPAALHLAGITAREAEVLDLLTDHLSNREIAERLYLSPRTVEKHIAALLAKLDTPDRTALTQLARSLH